MTNEYDPSRQFPFGGLSEIAAPKSPPRLQITTETINNMTVARCPEMGLLACDADEWAALEKLTLLMHHQIKFSREVGQNPERP